MHTSPWPTATAGAQGADTGLLAMAATVMSAIRKAKSAARLSMRAPAATVRIHGPVSQLESLRAVSGDITAAGNVGTFVLEDASAEPDLRVDVLL